MNLRTIVPCIGAVAALAACSGGGSGNSPATSTLPITTSTQSPATATGTLTISLPQSKSAASGLRKLKYVSQSTQDATLFIDSTANATRVACEAYACTIAWVSTPGSHTFTVETDDSTTILADGTRNYSLVAGPNGTLSPLILNASTARAAFTSGSLAANVFSGTYSLADWDENLILSPAQFDDAPIELSAVPSSIGVVGGRVSLLLPDAAGTDYPFTAACQPSATGTFSIVATSPVGPYSPNFTSAEITYLQDMDPAVNPPVMNTTASSYLCTNGTISLASSGELPVQ